MTDGTTDSGADLPLWRQVHDALAADIDAGRYRPGGRLPSEAALATRFAVNRHTVRRALAALGEAGRIHVRRGAGATVTQTRLDYHLGQRTRLGPSLRGQGSVPERRILRLERLRAGPEEAEPLSIDVGDEIVLAEVVALADGVPVSVGRSAFPAARLPALEAALAETASVTAAFARLGLGDYERLWTRLTAERPTAAVARHLRIAGTTPVLMTESLNVDADGRPVEHGRTWFCSERIVLVVDRARFTSTLTV